MHVLVVGCGYVGTALGLRLASDGHEVTGLRREPSGLPEPIRPLAADLDVVSSVTDASRELPPVDAVAVTVSAGGRDVAAYRRAYVEGPRRMLRLLARRGDPVRRVLMTSSSAVWGDQGGVLVDEATPAVPTSATGRVLVTAEHALLAGPFPSTVLRLTGIYGPTRTRLLDQVRAGQATIPAGGPTYTNRIHRDDAASALAHVLTLADPDDVYAVTDDASAPRDEVLTWLAEQLGAPAPRTEGDDPRRGNKRVSNARLRATGWSPTYPTFRDGYAAMLGTAGGDGG